MFQIGSQKELLTAQIKLKTNRRNVTIAKPQPILIDLQLFFLLKEYFLVGRSNGLYIFLYTQL